MPRSLPGLVLAGALLLAGCSLGSKNAEEPVEQLPITKAQLAAMVLPRAELGTIAAGTKPAPDGGAVDNAEAADSSLDPADTGRSLRSDGRLNGHRAYFVDGDLAALERRGGVFLVGTEVELLEDPVYAAQYLHKQLGDFERFQGKQDDGSTLSGVASFEVTGIGDEAGGLRATTSRGKQKLHLTAVAFRRDRIVAVAAVIRADDHDAEREARALAVKLDNQVQSVLADLTVQPPPAETTSTETAPAAAAERLPEVTLAAEDVGTGAVPVGEGAFVERSYSGFQRTFEDIVVGHSHLMRLQARTIAYDTPEQAAIAFKVVSQDVGRESFAAGIARAFGEATSVRPTNVRVRSLRARAGGGVGLAATFELVGAEFRMVSFFVRSGRYVQSVTGICRPDGIDQGDVERLARRAQARLVA
jgi:hypothetical protein